MAAYRWNQAVIPASEVSEARLRRRQKKVLVVESQEEKKGQGLIREFISLDIFRSNRNQSPPKSGIETETERSAARTRRRERRLRGASSYYRQFELDDEQARQRLQSARGVRRVKKEESPRPVSAPPEPETAVSPGEGEKRGFFKRLIDPLLGRDKEDADKKAEEEKRTLIGEFFSGDIFKSNRNQSGDETSDGGRGAESGTPGVKKCRRRQELDAAASEEQKSGLLQEFFSGDIFRSNRNQNSEVEETDSGYYIYDKYGKVIGTRATEGPSVPTRSLSPTRPLSSTRALSPTRPLSATRALSPTRPHSAAADEGKTRTVRSHSMHSTTITSKQLERRESGEVQQRVHRAHALHHTSSQDGARKGSPDAPPSTSSNEAEDKTAESEAVKSKSKVRTQRSHSLMMGPRVVFTRDPNDTEEERQRKNELAYADWYERKYGRKYVKAGEEGADTNGDNVVDTSGDTGDIVAEEAETVVVSSSHEDTSEETVVVRSGHVCTCGAASGEAVVVASSHASTSGEAGTSDSGFGEKGRGVRKSVSFASDDETLSRSSSSSSEDEGDRRQLVVSRSPRSRSQSPSLLQEFVNHDIFRSNRNKPSSRRRREDTSEEARKRLSLFDEFISYDIFRSDRNQRSPEEEEEARERRTLLQEFFSGDIFRSNRNKPIGCAERSDSAEWEFQRANRRQTLMEEFISYDIFRSNRQRRKDNLAELDAEEEAEKRQTLLQEFVSGDIWRSHRNEVDEVAVERRLRAAAKVKRRQEKLARREARRTGWTERRARRSDQTKCVNKERLVSTERSRSPSLVQEFISGDIFRSNRNESPKEHRATVVSEGRLRHDVEKEKLVSTERSRSPSLVQEFISGDIFRSNRNESPKEHRAPVVPEGRVLLDVETQTVLEESVPAVVVEQREGERKQSIFGELLSGEIFRSNRNRTEEEESEEVVQVFEETTRRKSIFDELISGAIFRSNRNQSEEELEEEEEDLEAEYARLRAAREEARRLAEEQAEEDRRLKNERAYAEWRAKKVAEDAREKKEREVPSDENAYAEDAFKEWLREKNSQRRLERREEKRRLREIDEGLNVVYTKDIQRNYKRWLKLKMREQSSDQGYTSALSARFDREQRKVKRMQRDFTACKNCGGFH